MDILSIYSDGGSRGNPGPAACAFLIYLNDAPIFKESIYLGIRTNNFAEYSGLLNALNWIENQKEKLTFEKIIIYMDSELVVRQMTGLYKIKNSDLKNFAQLIKNKEKIINKKVEYNSIPREKNKVADLLVNKILDEKGKNFTS